MGKHEFLKLSQLNIWTDNPRIAQERINDEEDAIRFIFEIVGRDKMTNLMTDVAKRNLDGNKQPTVVFNEALKKYDVYDGNRRITALKCIALKNEFGIAIENDNNISLDTEIYVYITSHQEAMELLLRDHAGESEGVGQIPWDSFERDHHLVKIGMQPYYTSAFEVAKICGLRRKGDFKTINYTELDSVYKNTKIKELFGIAEWDFDKTDLILFSYELLQKHKPGPYSRFLPELGKGENTEKVKKFVKDMKDEIDSEKDVLNVKLSKVSIYKGVTFSQIWLSIYLNKQLVEHSKCDISYVSPEKKLLESIDTNIVGTWQIVVKYQNMEEAKSFFVKDFESICINARKNLELEINNSYKFRDFLISATNSRLENVDNEITFCFFDKNNAELTNQIDIANSSIKFDTPGSYSFQLSYKDSYNHDVKTVTETFEVKNPLLQVAKLDDNSNGYFKSSLLREDVRIEFNYVINKLIIGLNSIYAERNKMEIFAAALRSLIESIIDILGEKDATFVTNSNGQPLNLDKKMDRLYDLVYGDVNQFSTKLYQSNLTKHASYLTIKNIIMQYEKKQYESLVSMLHLGAHKSTQCIDIDSIENKKGLISLIIEIAYLYLELY